MGRGPGPTTNIAKFAVTTTSTQPGYTTNLLQGNGVHVSNTATVPTGATGHYGYGMQDLNGDNLSLNTEPGPVGVTYPNAYNDQQDQADWPASTLAVPASFGFTNTTTGLPTNITHQDASNNLQTIAWGLKGSNNLSGVPDPQGCTGGITTRSQNGNADRAIQLGDLVVPFGPDAASELLGVALSRDGLFTAVSYKTGADPNKTSLAILNTESGALANNSNPILSFPGSDYNELGNLISMSDVDGDGRYYIALAQGGFFGFNQGYDFVAIYQFDPNALTNNLSVVDTSNSEGIIDQSIKENPALDVSAPGDIKILRISDDGNWVMTCAPLSTITAGGAAGDGVVQLYKNPKTLNGPTSSLKCVTVPCPEKNNNIGWGNLGDLATVAPSDSGDDGIVFVTQTQAGADFPAINIRYYRFDLNTGVLDNNSQPTNITLVGSPNSAPGYIPGLTTGPGFLEYTSIKSLRLNTDTSVNPDLNVLTITTDNGAFAFDIVATWRITYA